MKFHKKTNEELINLFLEEFDRDDLIKLFEDVFPLFYLYNVTEEDDWLKEVIKSDEITTIRIIRTVYLVSKIAERHASKLCYLKVHFKDLWKRLEKET